LRFLLLNQTFHPDLVSTAQHLSDLALGLVERGHEVTVLTGRRAYDDPGKRFPKREEWRGIRIRRIGSTGFGKGAKWRRAADFASFGFLCALGLVFLPRHDAVIALTSPPLISVIGALRARLWGSRFIYWVMDLNPDEAIAAKWLSQGSLAARVLDWMSRFSLRCAHRVIALDRFMRERIAAKGIAGDKIKIIPPWSHDDHVHFDLQGRERFREAHGLADKFVVMYSGNHSPCHPLDTLLAAAQRLADDPGVVFCFVGGGSEFRKIQKMVGEVQSPKSKVQSQSSEVGPGGDSRITHHASHVTNLLCLPYQPLAQLAGSLSAADLHVVVMGDPFVGTIHPCKLYNILGVAAPVLYIGPRPSHLSEVLEATNGTYAWGAAGHGEVDGVLAQIERLRAGAASISDRLPPEARSNFSKNRVLPQLLAELEGK
jgi:glycosyltransferase involved in cell wall biosynthesis